ncbi:alpha/beta hydrolase [Pseudenhygromyxa sp. WMMC2535]|uniref:alpha/beta hydrolase n=1 Tax=Pseudenhygromyxa sp. WMMC2535 TaxID=2712867 RepID=UPI0015961335|nr:alpha/beta hydrolase [Pseudenhygromyxa sp. WMMC2535]NVB39335.1 alpha/beta hydrolase [Pseudenhygromyxa sp. WMMC2535]
MIGGLIDGQLVAFLKRIEQRPRDAASELLQQPILAPGFSPPTRISCVPLGQDARGDTVIMQLDIQQIRQIVTAQLAGADQSLEGVRAAFEAMGAAAIMPEGVKVEAAEVGMPGEWITPDEVDGDRTLLYFHGGGYMAGSPASSRAQACRIAIASRARMFSSSYRLAPENPFPAALDDAMKVYRALLDQGVDASKLGLSGASAGGGLCVAACLRIRDQESGLSLPAAVGVYSPWLDLVSDSASLLRNDDPLCQTAPVQMMAQAYLAGHDPRDPLASPGHGDPVGLPSTKILVGGAEALRDESVAFGEKAKAAGAEVDVEVWDEMIHSWPAFAPLLPEALRAIETLGAFFRERVPC